MGTTQAIAFRTLRKALVEAPVCLMLMLLCLFYKLMLLGSCAGNVIAYASRALSSAEQNNSVIQKECLAAVFCSKAIHYLLEDLPVLNRPRPFTMAISS